MKTLLTNLLLIVGISIAQAQSSYTVKGKIGNYNAPAYIILNYKSDKGYVLDTLPLQNGSFRFTGKVSRGVKANLHLSPDGKGKFTPGDIIRFYLEKGEIVVYSPDVAANASVSGTEANVAYQRFQDKVKPFPIVPDSANALALKEFINENADSPILFTAVSDYINNRSALSTLETVYAMLPKSARLQEEGKTIANRIHGLKNIGIGSTAPDFTQADTEGKMVSLKDFRGKYLLIDFWASWCGPCRAENPNVVKAYAAYKDKNFTVLGISLDGSKGKENWKAAIKKDGLPWTQLSDLQGWNNAVAVLYDIHAVPMNFLLDPEGKIIAVNLRGSALNEKLSQLLN